MKKVIVVTGASSGFGALAARALAKAGHVVYATMRDTSGRNKGQVQEAASFAADHKVDLRTVELDVLSDASANAAITKVIEDNAHLDESAGPRMRPALRDKHQTKRGMT